MSKERQQPITALFLTCFLISQIQPVLAQQADNTKGATKAEAKENDGKTEGKRFDILEYAVEGNTVLPAIKIEAAVYPYLGPGRTIEDVEKARQSLEKVYQGAGYLTVLVDVPEQKVEEGVVKLRVTEGKVERLRVTGSRYYSLGAIRNQIPEAAEGTVPSFPKVQEQLAGLNRSADRRVTPVLRPGQTPGTVEVELKVEDELPLHGGLELNNRYSPDTKPLRLIGSVRYDNLWQREHSVALQYQTSPQDRDQVRVLSGTYLWPLDNAGHLLALYGIRSDSNIATLGTTTVIGNGNILGARFILPLPSRDGFSQTATFGIDHKDFKDSVLFGADQLNTPITYTSMAAQYAGTWQGKESGTQLNAGLNFALRGVLGNGDEEFGEKRFKAHANFAIWHVDAQHLRSLPAGWGALFKAGFQYAGAPVISNEQFAAGGVDTVRGYLESEALGDDGLFGRFELRTPPLWGERNSPRSELYGLAFLDGAALRLNDALESQKFQEHVQLSSGGLGLRLKAWKYLNSAVDVGWPFKNGSKTEAHDPRVHFKLSVDF